MLLGDLACGISSGEIEGHVLLTFIECAEEGGHVHSK